MDEIELEKIIRERVADLPDAVKKEIKSAQMNVDIIQASEHLKLHVDKLAILEDEVMLLLLGIDTSNSFVENVQVRMGISKDEAVSILKKLDASLFHRIRSGVQSETTPATIEKQQLSVPAATVVAPSIPQLHALVETSTNTGSSIVTTPSTNIAVEGSGSATIPKKNDPYREPFE